GRVATAVVLDQGDVAAARREREVHVGDGLRVRTHHMERLRIHRHVLTAQHHQRRGRQRYDDLVALVGGEGTGGAVQRAGNNDEGYGPTETAHAVQSRYVRSEHTIRGILRPDSDLERAAPFEVEIFGNYSLRRAFRCDIDHQHARPAHVAERLLARA